MNGTQDIQPACTLPPGITPAEVLDLRVRGWSEFEIATNLNLPSLSMVRDAIHVALRQAAESAPETIRRMDTMALDRLQAALMPYALGEPAPSDTGREPKARKPDPVAVGLVLQILKARRDYHGLAAPKVLPDDPRQRLAAILGVPVDQLPDGHTTVTHTTRIDVERHGGEAKGTINLEPDEYARVE